MTDHVVVGHADLRQFVARVFAAHDLTPDDAAWVADCLVEADLRGLESHGIARMPVYTRRLREGLLNPLPDIAVRETTAVAAAVHGDNGMGYVVARRAVDEAIARAQLHGVGVVAASHSNHYGMSATYMDRALDAGLASIVLTNAAPAMPMWGGRAPFLGTSPLAMAAPGGPRAVALDMATTVAARGKVRRALARGEAIPDGWALDDDGRPTTDPAAALRGVLLPLGGPKGSGLSLMIEIFAGVMTGAAFGGDVGNQNEDFDRPQNVGHFFFVMRSDLFVPSADYAARMDTLCARAKAGPRAAGVDEILLPGEASRRRAAQRRRDGIVLGPLELAVLHEEARIAKVEPLPLPAATRGASE